MTPDQVCGTFARSGGKIKVWDLDDETIVIEGTREGLLFMSDLFKAQAEANEEGSGLSPFGAGNALFAPGSTKGIYISRIE
jgi:hypothetical protein